MGYIGGGDRAGEGLNELPAARSVSNSWERGGRRGNGTSLAGSRGGGEEGSTRTAEGATTWLRLPPMRDEVIPPESHLLDASLARSR